MENAYISKEVSWLAFNERVLQEAADPRVPLLERLKFLGIYSSNRDEFFRVRVATLKRLTLLGARAERLIHNDPAQILEDVQEKILKQQKWFESLYAEIERELRHEEIYFSDGTELNDEQRAFIADTFHRQVRPFLIPILLKSKGPFPRLPDHAIYLAVAMHRPGQKKLDHALLRIPSNHCARFLQLLEQGRSKKLILLDDVIRLCLPDLFAGFDYDRFEAYSFKINRDAELDLDDELDKSYTQQLEDSLRRRKEGAPVRLTFDRKMPRKMLKLLTERMQMASNDTLIPGARYLNFKDLMKLPNIGRAEHYYPPFQPMVHPDLPSRKSHLAVLREKDVLLHHPYHSFGSFIDLLREAAIDPDVQSIKITAYRLAKRSSVINALVNAAQNGKKVTVVMELQARFDEEANLRWSEMLSDEGVRVVHGVHGLKVHGKLCLISRKEQGKKRHYACVGTGNFNEDTASLYTDHLLMTTDKRVTAEVARVFDFIDNHYQIPYFRHLIVAPFHLRGRTHRLIQNEIKAAREGRPAWIKVKINNLSDFDTVRLLNRAARAGVRIQLIVRSMFSLVPDQPSLMGNIEAISIVDRFLEHSRFFIFCNNGDPRYYISSGDWLPRNFDRRIEVACPIYDARLRQELSRYFEIQWQDNVKARVWNGNLDNHFRPAQKPVVQAQLALTEYLQGAAGEVSQPPETVYAK
ncbi:MAG: polyphosphate kinase 1 [Syntrophotaleaceae bacterium]